MKKTLITLLVLIIALTFSACTNTEENSYDGEKLSYTEMLKGDGTIDKRWYYKYYPDGEISTSMRCTEDGTCLQRNEYTYNEMNLKETETIYILGKKSSVTEYSYSEDGLLTSEKKFLPESITETIYHYNEDGTLDYYEQYDASEALVALKQCKYSAGGNLLREDFMDPERNVHGSIIYTYSNDQIKSIEYEGSAVTEHAKEVHTYDGENLIKNEYYNSEGQLLYRDTAEYDGDRCMHRMRVNNNNAIVYTWDAYYDSFLTLIG